MNPVDKYLFTKEKTAFDFTGAVKKGLNPETLVGTAAQGAVVAGGYGLVEAAKKVYQAMTKKRDFNKMMDAHPDLEDYRQQNPKQFMRHYDSLRSMNPIFAADPVIAGSYMRYMSETPTRAGHTIVESIGGKPPSGPSMQDFSSGMNLIRGKEEKIQGPKQLHPLEAKGKELDIRERMGRVGYSPEQIEEALQY